MDSQLPNELRAIATEHIRRVSNAIARSPIDRELLLIDSIRGMDSQAVVNPMRKPEIAISLPKSEIISWGWKYVVSRCLASSTTANALSLKKFEVSDQEYILTLLYQFGCGDLLSRTADMVEQHLLAAERTSTGFSFAMRDGVANQFSDILEFHELDRFNAWARTAMPSSYGSWAVQRLGKLADAPSGPGAWMFELDNRMGAWLRADIHDLMKPLVKVWKTNCGSMVSYACTPEIDAHFLALASSQCADWGRAAGLFPALQVGEVKIRDVMMVASAIVSCHLKHVAFVLSAFEQGLDISLEQSLTICSLEEELTTGIASWSGLAPETVARAIQVISLHPGDAARVEAMALNTPPLLISLGNGVLVRPVSSISKNPAVVIRDLLDQRESGFRDYREQSKEEWMRRDVYSLFMGTRYSCVQGSVPVRDSSGRLVTDLDAVVLDVVSGDLAIFQLKWQDVQSNSVRGLSSRASNFAETVGAWASRVEAWLRQRPQDALCSSLGLPSGSAGSIQSISLFAIGHSLSRVSAYGYQISNRSVAVANMPQLFRARREVGPIVRVIPSIHAELRKEMASAVKSKPLHVRVEVANRIFAYNDLWNELPDISVDEAVGCD